MIPADPDFWKSLSDTYWQAYWGEGYDLDLIGLMLRLYEAEDGIVWQDIEGGEAVWEWGPDCNPETAEMYLQSAIGERWLVEKRLRRKYSSDDVREMLRKHEDRVELHIRDSADFGHGEPANIEARVVMHLTGMLTRANGERPKKRELVDLIDALKASATNNKDNYEVRTARVIRRKLVAQGGDNAELLAALQELALQIQNGGLFKGGRGNVAKIIGKAVPQLNEKFLKSSAKNSP